MKYVFIVIVILCSVVGKSQHRQHVLGNTFSTYPPWYSCIYCNKEISPYEFLPKGYDYMDGYRRFVDSLNKKRINDDAYFMTQWNKKDTSCISSEIALNKRVNIHDKWLKTHAAGEYFLDKTMSMSTNGFISHYDSTGRLTMAYGGSFNEDVLLADKWYKIILDKPKKKK